jgi:lipopolysaccharide transport system permease protein
MQVEDRDRNAFQPANGVAIAIQTENALSLQQNEFSSRAPEAEYRIPPDEIELIIRPGDIGTGYWAELWRYRELFYFLAWRDLKVRYKQTVIGIAWAVIRPLLMMIIFTVLFSRIAGLTSPDDVPYPVLVMAGLIAWQFFAAVMGEGSNSILANASLITKVYFPRIIVPCSVSAVATADLAITWVLTLGIMAFYGVLPSWQIVFLPAFLILGLAAALGAGFWLSALTVRYRDTRFVTPFMVQFGLYVTPVGFSTFSVPEAYRAIFALNPMVGVIEGFRWCLFGVGALSWYVLLISVISAAAILLTGFRYFRATERYFADTI